MSFVKHVAATVGLCFWLALPSCSPSIIERVRTEYVDREVHHRDTLYSRDSVYIREWLKGDTVYVEKFRDRYIYRDRWRDSIHVRELRDTTVLEKKVEKELSAGQKFRIKAFWWLLCGLVICLGWIFRKPILAIVKSGYPSE